MLSYISVMSLTGLALYSCHSMPETCIPPSPTPRNRSKPSFLAAILVWALLCPACPSFREPLPLVRALPTPATSKIESALLRRLTEASGEERLRALVDLTEQVDLLALIRSPRHARRDKAARRVATIAALELVAARQQARIRPRIDRLLEKGELDYVRPIAIVNRLLVEGRASALLALSRMPEVARVSSDWTSSERSDRQTRPPGSVPPLGDHFRSWAISAMGADRLWAQGLRGEGVVVGIIDTGAYGEHEQLRGRSLQGNRGWFDPVQGISTPYDSHRHGTMVLSLAVGANPEGRVVGVAPAALWTVALGNWRNHYSKWRMSETADWMLRVARPDVLVNAWSNDEAECSDFDLPFINAWKAAEIFVVYPAGNGGPAPETGEAPASLTGTVPDSGPVFSVAALTRDGWMQPDSSRGPSNCGSPAFPSITAPGTDLPLASPGSPSAYRTGSGTSLAAGLMGGAAALLLQADPELTPSELERILLESSRDLPPPGRDDVSGAGSVDLLAALDLVRSTKKRRGTKPRQ